MTHQLKQALALLLALLLVLGVTGALAEAAAPEAEAAEAPQNFFAAMQLTYLDGTPFDASVFDGTPVFLNIWSTWCPPCVGEMPHLNELAKEYAGKIHIIGLHSEGMTVKEGEGIVPDGEKNALALKLQQDMGLSFPLLNPDQTLFALMYDPQYGLQVEVLPTTWLIDGKGYIRDILTGSRDKAGWVQTIDGFLAKLEEEGRQTDDDAVPTPTPEGTAGG